MSGLEPIAPRQYKIVSLSWVGRHYVFIGHSVRGNLPPGLRNQIRDGEDFRNVALGVGDAYYYSCKDKNSGRSHHGTNGPFMAIYTRQSPAGTPDPGVSLGTNNMWFAKLRDGSGKRHTNWHVDSNAAQKLGNKSNVEHMWFGRNGTWVAYLQDGTGRSHLGNSYAGLHQALRSQRHAPTAIAMNLENDREYLAVWENGYVSFQAGITIDRTTIMNFLRRNGYRVS